MKLQRKFYIPYICYYKPWVVYTFTPFLRTISLFCFQGSLFRKFFTYVGFRGGYDGSCRIILLFYQFLYTIYPIWVLIMGLSLFWWKCSDRLNQNLNPQFLPNPSKRQFLDFSSLLIYMLTSPNGYFHSHYAQKQL